MDEHTAYPWEHAYPSNVNWRAPLLVEPLTAMFDRSVAQFPRRPCMDFLGRKLNYGEVGQLVNQLAKGLQGLGIGKGQRVGLFLPNCPAFVIAYYAILKTGATVVNFNPLYAEREVANQVADSGIDLMITLDLKALYSKLVPLLESNALKRVIIVPMASQLPFPKSFLFPIVKRKEVAAIPSDDRHILWARLIDNDGRPKPVDINPVEDIAVLQYTGGTTGVPKGAMLTHANLSANTEQSALCFAGARPGQEKMLAVIPFFHVFAMTVAMNLGLRFGAELILLPRFELDALMEAIHTKRPTLFPAVPTIYTAINNHRDLHKYNLRSIKFCISGGAPLPVEVKHTFERNTGCKLVEGYGLSECSPVACVNPLSGVNKAGSIGMPLPQTIVEIVSLEDPSRPVAQGERGEVCIQGPQVMKGYWNRPQETALALKDGRLHTGDVGYMDEDGYIFIVDRIKDMILCGGYNVYPRNVEEAIYLHPSVAECIVAGVPDAYRGQTVKAYIRLAEGKSLTVEALKGFLMDKLSPIEQPKFIEFRDVLPKTMVGKLDRKALLQEEEAKAAPAHS